MLFTGTSTKPCLVARLQDAGFSKGDTVTYLRLPSGLTASATRGIYSLETASQQLWMPNGVWCYIISAESITPADGAPFSPCSTYGAYGVC